MPANAARAWTFLKRSVGLTDKATLAELATIKQVTDRLDEAGQFRQRTASGAQSLEQQWETAGHRYLGNHWFSSSGASLIEGFEVYTSGSDGTSRSSKGIRRFMLNRTQTSIISNVASQTQEPLQIQFDPVEYAEPDAYILTADAGQTVADLVMSGEALSKALSQAPPEPQPQGPDIESVLEPLETGEVDEAAQQEAAIEQSPEIQLQIQAAKLAFTPAQLGYADEQYQQPLDSGPSEVLESEQAGLVEQLIQLKMIKESGLIRIDDELTAKVAQKAFTEIWNYSGCDGVVLRNELYCNVFGHQPLRFQFDYKTPQFILDNPHILEVWIDPSHDRIDDSDYLILGHVEDADLARAKWPALKAEIDRAEETGQLQTKEYRLSSANRNTDFKRPMVRILTAWLRHQQVPMTVDEAMESGQVQESGETEGFEYALVTEKNGRVLDPAIPVKEGDGNWPDTIGIKQIVVLPQIERVVSEQRCPYWDIPFGWNVNIPTLYSPYGQGEPVRLEDVQIQINLILTILSNHVKYYQWPMRYWPKSLFAKLKSKGFSLHSRPGMEIPIADRMYFNMVRSGGVSMVEQVPAVPSFYIGFLGTLLDEHDRLSGDVAVRQGVPPSSDISGKAIDSLRAEALGPLSMKSKFTEWSLERVARLGLNAMVDFMTIEQWAEILNQYRTGVLEHVVQRMRQMKWNISVSITTGKGATQLNKERRAVTLRHEGLLSQKTAMASVGVNDPDGEQKRIDQESAKALAMQNNQQGPPAAQPVPQESP